MRVAMAGCAQTKYKSAELELKDTDVIFQTVQAALKESELSISDIDSVLMCSTDYLEGSAIDNVETVEPCGGDIVREEARIEADGLYGIVLGASKVMSGFYEAVLVVAYTFSSRVAPPYSMLRLTYEPFYLRPFLNEVTSQALQAQCYMQKYGVTREQAAKVVVKNRRNALKNPYAQVRNEVSLWDVLCAEKLATPLTRLDCPPSSSDGCCAVILVSEEKAKRLTDNPIWIKGTGLSYDTQQIGFRDISNIESCRVATKRAYEAAGIIDPKKEIDIAEVSDVTSFSELMLYEALGFCNVGEGGELIDKGVTEMSGALPVNPSGGVLSGNPYIASGLIRFAECWLQLKGAAGERQIANCKTALAHGTQGICMQSNCVVILGKD